MADQGSEGILSPFLRHQRFKAVSIYLKGRILEVGCGVGKLATTIPPDCYVGVELDRFSLNSAIKNFPGHRFQENLPDSTEKFDTIIALAVIEHVKNQEQFLADLFKRLKSDNSARIVLTTPHPSMDWVHHFGASVGLFSKHADEEHEKLLDRATLESLANKVGLRLTLYRNFLFGANQLLLFEPA